MHSVLASKLSQPGSQISLEANPFFSASSVEVPDIPSRWSTVGRSAESLIRGRISSPGVVPPSSQEDVMPLMSVPVSNIASVGLAGVSGSHLVPLGASTPVLGRGDQLRDCGDVGFTQHVVSDVHSVPHSVSSFNPSSLLFPFSDSDFSSLSTSAPPLSSFYVSSSSSVPSAPSMATPSTVPIFSLPSVVHSILSAPPLPSSFSFLAGPPFVSSSLPSTLLFSSLLSPFFSSRFLIFLFFCSHFLLPCVLFLLLLVFFYSFFRGSGLSSSSFFPQASTSSSSYPVGDFASYQGRVLGLSDEYQALGRWYFASGGADFPAFLLAHFPHLYSDFRLDFSFGSSRFLLALSSAPTPPVSGPSASLPSSSFSLTPSLFLLLLGFPLCLIFLVLPFPFPFVRVFQSLLPLLWLRWLILLSHPLGFSP